MALFNEILQGRWNAILHKLANMKDSAPAPQLASEIQPTINLENDRLEYAFLGGEKWCAAGAQIAAGGAGFMSEAVLMNPVGSGCLAVLEAVIVGRSTTGIFRIGWTDAAFVTGTGAPLDSRNLPTAIGGSSAMSFSSRNNAAATIDVIFGAHRLLANTTLVLPYRAVIHSQPAAPARGIIVDAGAVNEGVDVTMIWRERPVDASELR